MQHKVALIILATLLALVPLSCVEESPPQPVPDIPRYSADQVIYVAEAYSPQFSKYEQARYVCEEKPAWSAEYSGDGFWMVKKYAINGFTGEKTYVEGWIFDEHTGKLRK